MAAEVSADGSPVAVYAALPAEPDLGVVRRFAHGRRGVLDLGCGTGRICDPLAADGHDVVGVDESCEMLARVSRAETVCGRIESLDLGRRFDLVLLLSHLVNTGAAGALLATAARHVADDGLVLIQRLVPGRSWQPSRAQVGAVSVTVSDIVVDGSLISATSGYELDGQLWRQPWQLWDRSDANLTALSQRAGLRVVGLDGPWVTAAGRWRSHPSRKPGADSRGECE